MLNDFIIIDKLGAGSFSQVYKVQRKSDGLIYTMKKVNISLQNQKEKESTMNEVRILASLNNPYIIQYKDCFLEDGCVLYVIMEYAQDLRTHKFNDQEIWRAIAQIAIGLKCLHDNHILHRDLKLANIFVTQTEKGFCYKIGGFNFSKITHGQNAITQVGTSYNAAPEIWRAEQYSWPCDIWSFGCLIYEMSAGESPFNVRDYQKIKSGQYTPLKNENLNQFVSSLLRVNPKERPSCDKILKSNLLIKNSGSMAVETVINGKINIDLLQTIRIPQNLKLLKQSLPQSNYDGKIKRSGSCHQQIKSQSKLPEQPKQLPEPPRIARPPLQKQNIPKRQMPFQPISQRRAISRR